MGEYPSLQLMGRKWVGEGFPCKVPTGLPVIAHPLLSLKGGEGEQRIPGDWVPSTTEESLPPFKLDCMEGDLPNRYPI